MASALRPEALLGTRNVAERLLAGMMSRGNVKLFSKLCALSVIASAAAPFGCGSSETKPAAGSAGAAGAAGSVPVFKCGSQDCVPKAGIGIEKITQCCTDTDECGYQFPGATKCMLLDQEGNRNTACGNYTHPDVPMLSLSGCCGPQGCGKLDPFLGCIVNTDLGLPAQACTYDPSNDCSYIEAVSCDGSEDCPTGQRCCTSLGPGNLSRTGCYDSCSALITMEESANWRELCHATADCEDPAFQCLTSGSLPPWLYRCFSGFGQAPTATYDTSAGSVNCGPNLVCSNGQKCCVGQSSSTGPTLYCADANADCKCHP